MREDQEHGRKTGEEADGIGQETPASPCAAQKERKPICLGFYKKQPFYIHFHEQVSRWKDNNCSEKWFPS